jgi:hypothetical protein
MFSRIWDKFTCSPNEEERKPLLVKDKELGKFKDKTNRLNLFH